MKVLYDVVQAIADYAGVAAILLILPLALLYGRRWHYPDVLKSQLGLARVRKRLAGHGDWRSTYFGKLRSALDRVDRNLGQSAWSADSYEFTLTMAFIYPFASLFLVWIAIGENTSGIEKLLHNEAPVMERVLSTIFICICLYLIHKSVVSSGWRKSTYLLAIPVFAGAGALVGAVAGVVAVAVSLAIVAVTVVAGTVASVSAFTVLAAVSGVFGVAVTLAVVFTTFATVVAIYPILSRHELKGIFYLFYLPLILALLAIVISHPHWLSGIKEAHGFTFVFLLLLPLINSVFDWLSLAATRWLLKKMAQRGDAPALQVVWNAALGVILGLLLLAGLAVAVTAGVQTVNLLSQSNGGPQYVDLTGLLHRLRHNPADPAVWWVYATLFSTMLPTVAHAAVASASFVTWRLPKSWKQHWLGLLDGDDARKCGVLEGEGTKYDIKEDPDVLKGMAWRLALMDAATVVLFAVSTAVLAGFVVWLIPREGLGLLWLCERVAEWLGAPVQI